MSAPSARSQPIGIRNVTKSYDNFNALDSVSLDIASGEFMTLLGPSGSGKTTLLMVLAGFTRATSGHVLVGGEDMTRVPPHKRDFGMVFQNYALFPHMNVFGNVAYSLRLRGVGRSEIETRVARALDLVQLGHLGDRAIDALSGGQKQRIALARAIVFEPRVLLMDEPLSALDKNLREQMQIEIRSLHENLGITTVYVTHDQREALTMSDQVVVIDAGRISQIGAPRDIYERPANAFVADFIGESSLLPVEGDADGYRLAGRLLKAAHAPDNGRFLVVRPEKMEFHSAEMGDGYNLFEGTLQQIVYQGETVLAQIVLEDGQTISMRRTTQREVMARLPEAGSRITVALHPEDTIIVPEYSA